MAIDVQAIVAAPRRERRNPGAAVPLVGRLPRGWHVLRAGWEGVEAARGDHVVVGPPGVFGLCVRDLAGSIWVGRRSVLLNRRRTDFLAAVAANATRASAALSVALGRPVDVRGALAILADDWTIKEQPAGAFVGSPRTVRDWLARLPATMTVAEVEAVRASAERAR